MIDLPRCTGNLGKSPSNATRSVNPDSM